jgi:hypothetical protein
MDLRDLLPGALDILDLGLSAQPTLRSDLSSNKDDLRSKDRERIDHAVNCVGKRKHLALGLDTLDLLSEISSRDGGLRSKADTRS